MGNLKGKEERFLLTDGDWRGGGRTTGIVELGADSLEAWRGGSN